jgi:hypothetical protein
MYPEGDNNNRPKRSLKTSLTNFAGSIIDRVPNSWGKKSLDNPIFHSLFSTAILMGITAINHHDNPEEYTQALRVTALAYPAIRTIFDRVISSKLFHTEPTPLSQNLATSAMTLFVSLIQ